MFQGSGGDSTGAAARARLDQLEADRDRIFLPFQRLGDTGSSADVGLGLMVSRGLTEAMRGTLTPEQTPGAGLTMAILLPAAPGPAPARPSEPGRRDREGIGST